jgi:hypothetical protein
MASPPKQLHVRFRANQAKDLAKLPIHDIDIGCMGGFRKQGDGTFALEAVVSEKLLEKIKKAPVKVEVLADLDEQNKRAKQIKSKHVGRGNRYEGKDWIPRGLGKKVVEGEPS